MADIFRTIKNKNYTVMSNHHLQNPNLSLKAMGLMSKILSLPEDWNYSVKGLAAYCKDGYESVRTALLELEAEGYLIRRTLRGERGKIAGTEYIFRETPDMEVPETEEEEQDQAAGKERNVAEDEEQIEAMEDRAKEVKKQEKSPGLENPITVKKEPKPPGSENPITVKKPREDPPGSGFPSTVNRDQQNTNKQKTIYNIYTSSSSSNEENKIYIGEEEEEEKTANEIKARIGYEKLCREYGNIIPDGILKLLLEIFGQGESAPFYIINDQKVDTATLRARLAKLDQAHVQAILEGMATGPPVRNARRYLLTALYNSDMAVHINRLRKKGREKKNPFNNFHQRDYNMAELERQMLGWKKQM
ncbi:MAG TPA: helix-turn-helix domain-containing protein [Candidatus Blautia ornithocaccae]|nr:helix-turn-helix domain-containing protein [Candidatus Blautia ornithocaccae]